MTKTTKKKVGRPLRCNGQALGRLTLILDPKLKLGIDLLARHQHRSLSQAVEFALEVALHSIHGRDSDENLGDILDMAWSHDSMPKTIREIYCFDPSLLSFEDAKACELINGSIESSAIAAGNKTCAAVADFDALVSQHWTRLQEHAVALTTLRKPLKGHSLTAILAQKESTR